MLSHSNKNNIFDMQVCEICQGSSMSYAFMIQKIKFLKCDHCFTIVSDSSSNSFGQEKLPATKKIIKHESQDLCKFVYKTLKDHRSLNNCLILTSNQFLLENLRQYLPEQTSYQEITKLDSVLHANIKFSSVLLLCSITLIPQLKIFLQKIRQLLHPQGQFIFLQSMLDSAQAKIMRRHWLEWRKPHCFYPTRDALHLFLLHHGFNHIWFRKISYKYTLNYIYHKLKDIHAGLLFSILGILIACMPKLIKRTKIRLPSGSVLISCQNAEPHANSVLSIIMPVYNEKNTFEMVIQELLAKKIAGLQKQIIIVESQSTDGTKNLVKKYENHPEVEVIWQERPQGKGFAVRAGLEKARGDYILIQDADLEYDLNDYECLLKPLRNNQAMFVLGSRHRGSWKMRKFNDAPMSALVFNIGHMFFTWILNVLTNERMTDPFTMFKVFRRDAIYGLNFNCNRFDFDHELVIKLCRKGYKPLEIPVNYCARSFSEGKKVSFLKDGLTWLTTDLKLRFGRLGRWPN